MNLIDRRSAGVLLHITSLPSPYGIGDLGPEAHAFAHKLAGTGATLWQLLPLGPTGFGNSPYNQRSAFAGNELLLSPDELFKEGLLSEEDLKHPDFPSGRVDFQQVTSWKLPLLHKAAANALADSKLKRKINAFRRSESFWIEDYAEFMVLYTKYQDARWHSVWDPSEGRREENTMRKLRRDSKAEIDSWVTLQYFFSEQMSKLKAYANSLGIKLIGDIPIFAGADSADTWSHIELFKTDEDGVFSAQAGVPPDTFSVTGQLWGNPVYDWQKHIDTDFQWWTSRIKRCLELCDIVRIDHFRGFSKYFEIKAGEKTAEKGKWKPSPGRQLFRHLRQELGDLPLVAEDLGIITPDVVRLRTVNHFPGMKIAQDGFNRDSLGDFNTYDKFLPHNYGKDFIAYTGTHDNHTARGWYNRLSPEDKHMVREYLSSDDDYIVWALIKSLMLSHAAMVIIPLQDILGLDDRARMNTPSTCNDLNWSWRVEKGALTEGMLSHFSFMLRISGRNGMTYEEKMSKKPAKT